MSVIELTKDESSSSSTVDEFSSHEDIQESDLEPEDLVVEQLSDGSTKLRERGDEHVIKADPNSEYVEKYFDESEIEELSSQHEVVNGKPTGTPSIEEVYQGMKEDIEAHNREVARNKMQKELESAKEQMKEHTKYGTPVQELEGGDFLELLQESQGNGRTEPEGFAEVKEQIREKYSGILEDSEPDIKDPNDAVENLSEATDAFREYDNPVFEELADDMEKSNNETMYESVDEK